MQISAYLFFYGRTEEALRFYQSALGGEVEISRNREAPFAADLPLDSLDNVMHGTLRGDDFNLMASDNRPGFPRESDIALCIAFSNEAKARNVFDKLSAGGNVTIPLQQAFWGALFAQFTDKYGINWMVNCG
jgi:PhnB protein